MLAVTFVAMPPDLPVKTSPLGPSEGSKALPASAYPNLTLTSIVSAPSTLFHCASLSAGAFSDFTFGGSSRCRDDSSRMSQNANQCEAAHIRYP
ncbi:hypothetical protein EW146_g9354 [Bondarzewia mesenterica]|uniref:Uncharacterized protein n=1 Tax=Bondarzewia mesenterica TaxID=1095465 RepID=A0A4S4L7B0_9AGAM|nr:hypothetical protein EW146_g9354 [Bondarzewia mesenterica]